MYCLYRSNTEFMVSNHTLGCGYDSLSKISSQCTYSGFFIFSPNKIRSDLSMLGTGCLTIQAPTLSCEEPCWQKWRALCYQQSRHNCFYLAIQPSRLCKTHQWVSWFLQSFFSLSWRYGICMILSTF